MFEKQYWLFRVNTDSKSQHEWWKKVPKLALKL